ncbi:MAG: SDR family NAD(P)-dependent oxidoreductase [Bacteroidetes bacterium]|jgi:NAD(P)-dependent dehydrogenase (short-subunit alcohol dehydrogenase family)|nr:SDR family NAD(P)-dependent oxidoreductase [Bacteroidota bacterium]
MRISDHTFLITGGSSGLGAGTARRLVAEGARVVLADVNEDDGHQQADQLGDRARFVATDVTDPEAVERAIATAMEHFGGLHGVVNCAGIVLGRKTVGRKGPHDLESFARLIQVNLIGTFNVIRLAAAVLAENTPDEEGERGVIVNTASIAAFDGQIGQAAYAASKGGVVSMTLPISRDLARHGIRVMTIAPGIFETPMMAGMPDDVRASLEEQVPFPSRLGRPSEFARLAQQIIENPMLNGEVIRLDGAIRMGPR